MNTLSMTLGRFVEAIGQSGLSIYDPLVPRHARLWIPIADLEFLLDRSLTGLDLHGLPLRTRSKIVKEHVCQALGYPTPRSFKRTQPRFPGQRLDVYTQKSLNLQIWNEDLEPDRRYALVRIGPDDKVKTVRVLTGQALAPFDTTGILTRKYQARLILRGPFPELFSQADTESLLPMVATALDSPIPSCPTDPPTAGHILSIDEIFRRLGALLGTRLKDAGHDQERNRGAALHRLACESLGYSNYRDDGRFPDIPNQLLEMKLQTASTIDLGLVRPDSLDRIPGIQPLLDAPVRYCDVRYAVFFGFRDVDHIELTHLFVVTGQDFFFRFPQFKGRTLNAKLQLSLPPDLFDHE